MNVKNFLQLGAPVLAAIALFAALGAGPAVAFAPSAKAASAHIDVRLVTDEADAVLAILDKRRAHKTVTDADWEQLFSTDGYQRLKKREESFKRPFTEEAFKTFTLSDKLLGDAPALAHTLAKWKKADVTAAGGRALAYLPANALIKAKIYPVIKPQSNSFVFDTDVDPAIFLYLNPEETKAQFENKLAHELHHIGYSSACPTKEVAAAIDAEPDNVQTLVDWIGAFGEGFAMLAAAGGPDIHPHAVSKPEDRARWDNDMANYNDDLHKVEAFFLDILNGKLTDDQRNEAGGSFFGVQGPWYTVGWKMAVVIEKTFGRPKLIECICDRRKLLKTYNEAAAIYNKKAAAPLATWSPALAAAVAPPEDKAPAQ